MYLFYFMKYLLTIQTVTRALSTTTASETNIYQLLGFVAAKKNNNKINFTRMFAT